MWVILWSRRFAIIMLDKYKMITFLNQMKHQIMHRQWLDYIIKRIRKPEDLFDVDKFTKRY